MKNRKRDSYAGRIGNMGQQRVEALFPGERKGGKALVHKGEDLRCPKSCLRGKKEEKR